VESLVRTIRAYFSANQKQFDQLRLVTILSVDLIDVLYSKQGSTCTMWKNVLIADEWINLSLLKNRTPNPKKNNLISFVEKKNESTIYPKF
jgi:hypothetical protein